MDGECAASECSLLCNDFLRLGYTALVVDPGVRQAYTPLDAGDLYDAEHVVGVNITDWADVAAAPKIDWALTPLRPFYKCGSITRASYCCI